MSRIIRKPAFCICENKDADQLRGDREADQRLCFRYLDSTIPPLPIYEISSLWPSCVVVQSGLCGAWSETPKTGFLRTRLILAFGDRQFQLGEINLYVKPFQIFEQYLRPNLCHPHLSPRIYTSKYYPPIYEL